MPRNNHDSPAIGINHVTVVPDGLRKRKHDAEETDENELIFSPNED